MEYKALKDIAKITMGQSPDSSSYNEDGDGIPFFQGNADFGEVYPSERIWCNDPKKIAEPEDILISVRAPIGALNYAKDRCCIGRGLAAITIDDEAERNYVFHLLKAKNSDLNNQGTGSTFKAIGKAVLEDIQVPQISQEEQQKCMDMMDLLESIIRERRAQLSSLDELIKARFVELFGNPVINEKGWNTSPLNDVCDGIGDGLHGTPEYDIDGDYPFINGNNLMDGSIEITPATKMVDERTYKKHYIEITDNAILLSINGTLGKLAFYRGEEVMLGKSACYCNLKPEINREFVYGVMKTDDFSGFLESNSTASTIKNVGLKAIRGFNLILPPDDLQNEYVEFAKQVDKSK
ncbi:MAG: restriction endonuclease subunit S, partial [Bacillota bacterium]|nr:restriction endonuclease subunit S [Bacillota bacterium]